MAVPASSLYDIDWPAAACDVPDWQTLSLCAWPLKDGSINSELLGTSTFVKGRLDVSIIQSKKRKWEEANPDPGAVKCPYDEAQAKKCKYYCAQCPPERPLSNVRFQGSWGNKSNIGTAKSPDDRIAAFKHSCTGSCQEDQRSKWELTCARVSVHLIADPSKKKVILTEWDEYDIMKLRHDRKMVEMRGPVATELVKVGNKVRAFLQIIFFICILYLVP